MEIFFRLLLGHFLADFTFQTNFIARWKRLSNWGLFVHVAIHPICYAILTYPFLLEPWFTVGKVTLNGLLVIPILAILHGLEDWFRVRQVNAGWPDNTMFYLWDQVVHIVLLWLFSPTSTQLLLNPWPIVATLFVIVTHCATVTIWFIEKDINGRDYPDTEEKYMLILQRFVVWLAFFLPSPWWFVTPIIVLATFVRHVWKKSLDYSWTSVVMGNALAIICGSVVRFGLKFHF